MTLFCPALFRDEIIDYFDVNPCALCGQIHPVKFHQKIERTFRYNSDKHNTAWKSEKNTVYRVRCKTSKDSGNQYTLTILPHFLLPGCLVRADDVFNTGIDKDVRGDIDKAYLKMGVLDKRTLHKHLSRFDACLKDFVINLAMIISKYGEELPDNKPEKDILEININWFKKLALTITSIREKYFGFENLCLLDIAALFSFFIHPSYPRAACQAKGADNIYSFFLRAPPCCG